MITLYTFGPAFGLPDPSPFVIKAMLLLKMAGLSYKTDSRFSQFRKAPKGKLPYIDDDGLIVADSYFIRRHIEAKYGFDYDAGLNEYERAVSYSIEKQLEDTLYWATVYARWIEPQNWPLSKEAFFGKMPVPMKLLIPTVARRQVKGNLAAQGLGRHAPAEIRAIADHTLDTVATILGDKPFLMGNEPCGADATVLAFLMAAAAPVFTSSVVDNVRSYPNLIAYCERLGARYFDLA